MCMHLKLFDVSQAYILQAEKSMETCVNLFDDESLAVSVIIQKSRK